MATVRRLYKQGNSVVMSVPYWMLEMVDLALGDEVIVDKIDGEKALRVQKWNPVAKPEIDRAAVEAQLDLEE